MKRRLVGIKPINGSPWLLSASHLAAGVLAGVGEEAEESAVALGVIIMPPLQQSKYSLICFTCSDDIKAVFPTPE